MRQKRSRLRRRLAVFQRRLIAWFDRWSRNWLELVPSWGSSVLLHATLILLLALWLFARSGTKTKEIQAQFATQLTEDLTSLGDSDHAGDPFTTIKTDDSPSMSIEPAPDEEKISQPMLPSLEKFAPDLTAPERALDLAPIAKDPKATLNRRLTNFGGKAGVLTVLHSEDMTAPFAGRDPLTKAKMVRREGGTVRSEKAVDNGLDWIVRHQRADGAWSLDTSGQCQGDGCPPRMAMHSDTGATGLALLPLLGAGHIHTVKTRYQANVRTGLTWLLECQQATGEMFTGGDPLSRMYSHAIATMALCEAYGLSQDPKLKRPAQAAIDFIVSSQDGTTGGWRYYPGQAGDTSVFGWQMFALRSARLSGLSVPKRTIKSSRTYLDLASSDKYGITYGYTPGREATAVMTAEALLTRQYLGWPREFPPMIKGAGQVAVHLEQDQERNIYYWYYATQLLHNMQNKDWKTWNVRVRDGLVGMQVTGTGCDSGSWDPLSPQRDRWGAQTGRLFTTALSVLTLEVYYRYLPLYGVADKDKNKLDEEKDKDKPDAEKAKDQQKPAGEVGPAVEKKADAAP
jgi:hypothetical protein